MATAENKNQSNHLPVGILFKNSTAHSYLAVFYNLPGKFMSICIYCVLSLVVVKRHQSLQPEMNDQIFDPPGTFWTLI
jgi:hypothetical protein